MGIQRNRLIGNAKPPDRQIRRSDLTTFQESVDPSSLNVVGPSMVGDASVSQLSVDDGIAGQKLLMKDGSGIRWLDAAGEKLFATFRQDQASFDQTNRVFRQGGWAERDVGGGIHGNDVGRIAFIALNHTKIPGSEGTVSDDNRAFITLAAQANTTGANQALIQIEGKNDEGLITIQCNKFQLSADPKNFSKYSGGTLDYQEFSGTHGSIAGSEVNIVQGAQITTFANRKYKVTCGWPRVASTTAADTIVEMRIQEVTAGTLKAYRFSPSQAGASIADCGAVVSAVTNPGAGTHQYQLVAIRTSGPGTLTVVDGWILVEDIGF